MKNMTVLMGFILSCQMAFAHTGNDLKKWFEATDRIDQDRAMAGDYQDASMLMGYVWGVIDARRGYFFCIPQKVTMKQVLAITTKYLNDNPSEWNLTGAQLVTSALVLVFPCKTQ